MNVEELNNKLDRLLAMHDDMSRVIDKLKVEIQNLDTTEQKTKTRPSGYTPIEKVEKEAFQDSTSHSSESTKTELYPKDEIKTESPTPKTFVSPIKKPKIDLEKLIGENLINKVGILILIIGVAIGAKYSIENNLINPLTRIILGYLTGAALLLTGIKLKAKYTNYSAVLVSGAMAIFYFITFFAYSFYDIFNQMVAFGLMVIFTIFTVIASLNYNKQIIAHIGLVGAIAVPFLLSNGSGNHVFLFSYLLLINVGIFIISLKKQWNKLFYSAFGLTWLFYLVWMAFSYKSSENLMTAFGFATAFFLLFYAIFVTYKVMNLEKYKKGDIVVLLINSIIFYAVGYSLIEAQEFGSSWLGIFTIVNAVVHFIVAKIIQAKKSTDKNLFYLVIGLVIVFLTMAIPVQLDGSYVTIMWMVMAALLFWIGRTKGVQYYEYLSYGLILLACVSLAQDWEEGYRTIYYYTDKMSNENKPILNTTFLASVVSIFSLGFISWVAQKEEFSAKTKTYLEIIKFTKVALPVAFLGILYLAFFKEIEFYFNQLLASSTREIADGDGVRTITDYSVSSLSKVWIIIYSMLFMSGLLIAINKWAKNITIHKVAIGGALMLVFTFLTGGLYDIGNLRKAYIDQINGEYYDIGFYYLWLRYLAIAVFIVFCYTLYRISNKYFFMPQIKIAVEIIIASIIIWLLSSELIHWVDFSQSRNEYGLGLSILWGIFSATIIAFGIWKRKKHLRLMGIAIFGITLVKLFIYDLASLSTMSKTIVLVALGILLLATSFLYNKYTIDDSTEEV